MTKREAALDLTLLALHAACAGMFAQLAQQGSAWWWLAAAFWLVAAGVRVALLTWRIAQVTEHREKWRAIAREAIDALPDRSANVVHIHGRRARPVRR